MAAHVYLIKFVLAVSLLETNIHQQSGGEEEALLSLLYFNSKIVPVSDFLVSRMQVDK